MNDRFKNMKDQASDKFKNIKDGVSNTADRVKSLPGEATSAAADMWRDFSGNVSAATSDKMRQWVQEFNAAIPSMKLLGFSVKSFSVGIGLVPELNAVLVGSVDALRSQQLQEMVEQPENRALRVLVSALQTAAKFKDQLTTIGVKSIELRIKLGLPPLVTIDLLT